MALHPDFPDSPHVILNPGNPWGRPYLHNIRRRIKAMAGQAWHPPEADQAVHRPDLSTALRTP